MYLFDDDKRCPVCGKSFCVMSDEWAYKRRKSNGSAFNYFCSWKCLRTDERKREATQKKSSTSAKGSGEDIMRMIIEGKKNHEICKTLGVASGTVSYYRGRMNETEWLKEVKEDQG